MIRGEDAVAAARGMLGTPYSEMDCIALIVRVIRTAPGGVRTYRCQGTNWLWRSAKNSPKYRDLTARSMDIGGARAGTLVFKASGGDVRHVGLATGEGTVIHSSSAAGCVVESPLCRSEGWNRSAEHRLIGPGGAPAESDAGEEAWTTLVNEAGQTLALRGRWREARD